MTQQNHQVLERGSEMIADLLANPDTFSQYNQLLTFFVRGLPISFLGDLLQHSNDHVISGVLFIAEELGEKACPVIKQIIPHARNMNPRIRISAYDAIATSTFGQNQSAFAHVVLGICDPDFNCRKIAMLWVMRVQNVFGLKVAIQMFEQAGAGMEVKEGLQFLLEQESKDVSRVRDWILSGAPMKRKFGLIAAGRVASAHPELLELAASSEDIDLNRIAPIQLKFIALRQNGNEN